MLSLLYCLSFFVLSVNSDQMRFKYDGEKPDHVVYSINCDQSAVKDLDDTNPETFVLSGGKWVVNRPNTVIYDADGEIQKFSSVPTSSSGIKRVEMEHNIDAYLPCKERLSSGTIDLGNYKGVSVRPRDDTTPSLLVMRTLPCCYGPGANCQAIEGNGCFEKQQTCIISFTAVKGSTQLPAIQSRLCKTCTQKKCFSGNCKNGQFAKESVELDPVTSLSIGAVACIPCTPGTWNTCTRLDTCEWSIPEIGGVRNLGTQVHTSGNGPLGSCYPCEAVVAHAFHYRGMKPPRRTDVDVSKPYVCPGRDEAPRNCNAAVPGFENLVANPMKSKCICMDGWYGSEEAGCTICPEGHFCVGGGISPCKDHHYQPGTGKSSCERCTSTGERDGTPAYNCGTGKLLRWCQSSNPDSQKQALSNGCVPCNQCSRSYVKQQPQGVQNCYDGT